MPILLASQLGATLSVCPAIQPVADPERKAVVHGRVAKGALNTNGLKTAVGLEEPG